MKKEDSVTFGNLQAAFAGESMAHIKYLYFASLCRKNGDEDTAKLFEETAKQEVMHAIGHAELIFHGIDLTPEKCLEIAVEGETHEYAEMYPKFVSQAEAERNEIAQREFSEQIAESIEHAQAFAAAIEKARRRFDALKRVEKRHAGQYQAALKQMKSK